MTTPQLEMIPVDCRAVMADYLLTIEPLVVEENWINAADTFAGSSLAAQLEAITSGFIPTADEFCVDVGQMDLRFSVVSPFAAEVAPGSLSYVQFMEEYIGLFGVQSGCPFWLFWRWGA